jgi:hypothetical protein
MPEQTQEFDPERPAPDAILPKEPEHDHSAPAPTDDDPHATVLSHVITDIRAMFAHLDPATMEVVKDLRAPKERGVLDDELLRRQYGRAIDMRAELYASGIDPHAVPGDADENDASNAVEYIEHLRLLRNAKHLKLNAS